MKQKRNWLIMITSNSTLCRRHAGKEEPFLQYMCDAHTEGLARHYAHPELQLVLDLPPWETGYILNTLGDRIRAGEKFKPGDLVQGVFLDCPIRLDATVLPEGKALRVIIPDGHNRWPEDPDCEKVYNLQTLPMEMIRSDLSQAKS